MDRRFLLIEDGYGILHKNNNYWAMGWDPKPTDLSKYHIKDYYMSKLGAYEDCPFGDVPICYKLNGKIFAQHEELLNMIDLAYDTVFSKFSKKEQKRILEEV